MTVVTGVSGSGKSSLAFDTLYAEGQRRYVESVSTYAKQFLGRLPRPDVDTIFGPVARRRHPAIEPRPQRALDGRDRDRGVRLPAPLFARIGLQRCPIDGRAIVADSPGGVVTEARAWEEGIEVRVFAPVRLPERLPWKDVAQGLVANGYLRIGLPQSRARMFSRPRAAAEAAARREGRPPAGRPPALEAGARAAPDRGAPNPRSARGDGRLLLQLGENAPPAPRSERRECPVDGLGSPSPSRGLFSFNSPLASADLPRLGDVLEFDPAAHRARPAEDAPEGVIDPWAGSWRATSRRSSRRCRKKHGVPLDVPWSRLSPAQRAVVMDGGPASRA